MMSMIMIVNIFIIIYDDVDDDVDDNDDDMWNVRLEDLTII